MKILFGLNFLILTLFFLSNHITEASQWEEDGLIFDIPEKEIKVSKEEISGWIKTESALQYSKGYDSEIENINFCPVSQIICSLSKTQEKKYSTQKIEKQTFNEENITIFLKDLAEKFNKKPIDASFIVEDDGKISNFSLSQDGYAIDIEKSLNEIILFLSKKQDTDRLKLSLSDIKPDIEDNNAEKLGIKELISEGKSNFSGSTLSRIHNIRVATNRFNGVLIKPGKEFSFVKILGEVDGEHGYKQELVIKKGVTEPEFGGGICQVSTTAFRAAINAGLEITARRNHAYPVHYYNPQGMDAAVYIPSPDLRFKNNTLGHILIKTELNIEKKELIFKFYGTNDNRKVEIEGPKVLSRETDGAMKTVFYQKVTDKNGNIIIDEDFKSNYKSPNDYPKPGEILTAKPKNWSNKEWQEYKKDNNL